METDRDVLDYLVSDPKFTVVDTVTVTFSKTISRPVKIQFWQAYLKYQYEIPQRIRESYTAMLLIAEANAPQYVIENIIARKIRYTKFNDKIRKFIDLAFQFNLNIHNIVKECLIFETFQYVLEKGFVPEHYNYLNTYLDHTSYFKKDMIELLFSITPKDILYTTSIARLAHLYFGRDDTSILFECVEAALKRGITISDYGKPFGENLIYLDVKSINQLLIDYRYPFTNSDLKFALEANLDENLLRYLAQTVPDISLDNQKYLIYRNYLPGGDMEFSLQDFMKYTNEKNKQIFSSFLAGTVARIKQVFSQEKKQPVQLVQC